MGVGLRDGYRITKPGPDPSGLFRARFKEILRVRGVSQYRLAKQIGVRAGTVTHWALGRRQPSLRHLVYISDVLDVSLDWLCGRWDGKAEIES